MTAAPIWSPDPARACACRLRQFIDRYYPAAGSDYAALHHWSITEPTKFWSAVAEFCGLKLSQEPDSIVEDFNRMPGARWFEGARLNYAENLLEVERPGPAIVFVDERGMRQEISSDELRHRVGAVATALEEAGVSTGDCVAGILPNTPECVIAALAAASIGAVWSSCSPEFGTESLIDRLGQIEPKALFGVDGYTWRGKTIECLTTLRAVADALPSVTQIVVTHLTGAGTDLSDWPQATRFAEFEDRAPRKTYAQVPFDHPLFVLYSSGTTGKPKCIVHGTGGTLLQHMKEHQLHTDIAPGDRVFYYTTCGWMMWNWLVSALASGATIVLYDGAPMHPNPNRLWQLAADEDIAVFGTSASYLAALERTGAEPAADNDLGEIRAVLSTGSPLAPASFDFVYTRIGHDLMLASIAGGTDLISCFVLGNPMLPVHRGEIQCKGLGMDVRILDYTGEELVEQKGELCCTSPFPSMPAGFWNDNDGTAYRRAYFERFPGIWHHGDYAELTENGGIVMHGRSDATLNAGGVRIGTAEIYRIVEQIPGVAEAVAIEQKQDGDSRVVLFVRLAESTALNEALEGKIRSALRERASPRHVPALILAVADIPRTLNGKISERAVSDAMHGREIGNLAALANPESVARFRQLR